MKFQLRKPCKNCPFRNGPDRIKFRGVERAGEIAESAYRYGFPCHKSAVLVEHDHGGFESEGYAPGPNTQHCAGALAVFAQDSHGSPWPGINNDEDELERIIARLEPIFPEVFESEEAFIEANRSW